MSLDALKQQRRLVVASGNTHKIGEMRALFALYGLDYQLVPATAFDADFDPPETGSTYGENAFIKAKAAVELSGLPAMADDTGLEVAALDGGPGLYSARYAGEQATFADNVAKLLKVMAEKGVGDDPTARRADFVCHLTLLLPSGKRVDVEERLRGEITTTARGTDGFGYDPVFRVPSQDRTLAELTADEKNRVSHRSLAVQALSPLIA